MQNTGQGNSKYMNITLIVPTHMDRTHYLKRMLSFYDSQNFDGKILIGDSSEKPALSNNKKLIKKFPNLDIKHFHFLKSKYDNAGKLVANINKHIETDYVCFCGDDDFQIPEVLNICINFLNYNPDYVGAHGGKIKYEINLYDENTRAGIENLRLVRGQYADIDDPVFRFRCYMKSETSPQYHVIRKSVWENMYRFSFSLPNNYFLVSEVLPCSIYYISGKVKRFDDLIQYFMEQTPISYQSENADYIIKGINSPEWGECVSEIKNIIVELLIEKGVAEGRAISAFDEGFNFRILTLLHDQFINKYKESINKFNILYQDHFDRYDRVVNVTESMVKDSMNGILSPIAESISESNK